jgi:signal peptidase I
MITRISRLMTAAGALLLLTVALTACGGSSNATNANSSRPPRRSTAEVPSSPLRGPRSVHALRKFVECMHANGVKNFPGASEFSTAIKNFDTTSPTFEKASVRCYDFLLRALPEAKLTRPNGSTIDLVPYRVPSGSMEPTLPIGARAYLEPLSGTPKVGDIVIFNPPEGAEEEDCGPVPHIAGAHTLCAEPVPKQSSVKFVKRIVAGPGDTIYISAGHVYRNGVREQDTYIKACGVFPECNYPHPIKIPPGHWFMMGDNRGESDDSRFWGPIPTGWIFGTVRRCSSIGPTCRLTTMAHTG